MIYLRKIWEYLTKTNVILKIALICIVAYHIQYRTTTANKINHLINLYGKVNYDVNKLPDGLVLYKSVKPLLDESTNMLYYEVGIWDYSKDYVYYVRVPHYAHNRFVVGMEVRAKDKQNNSEEKKESMVMPYSNV